MDKRDRSTKGREKKRSQKFLKETLVLGRIRDTTRSGWKIGTQYLRRQRGKGKRIVRRERGGT